MEKLVDIVLFLHLEIREAFGAAGIVQKHLNANVCLFLLIERTGERYFD